MRARFVVRWRTARCTARSCPVSREWRRLRGSLVPHQPVGLRVHRRRIPAGGLDQIGTTSVIGIIGTGATAVQCVPHLGAKAQAELFVFQRTPSSIDVRADRPTDPEWESASLQPGWQNRADGQFQRPRLRQFRSRRTSSTTAGRTSSATCSIKDPTSGSRGRHLGRRASRQTMELADFEKMEEIRATRGRRSSQDPKTWPRSLKPWYRQFCKRPCFPRRLPTQAFNRPNVTLVDTDGKGIDRVHHRTQHRGPTAWSTRTGLHRDLRDRISRSARITPAARATRCIGRRRRRR